MIDRHVNGPAGGGARLVPLVWYVLPALTLQACSSVISRSDSGPPPGSVDVSKVADAVPRVEPRSKYGNPDSYVVNGRRYYVLSDARNFVQSGIASWYGSKFQGGRTSNGETYDMYKMTAAHKTLPLPTYVQVTNLDNGKQCIVRVNDRGPFHENRIIDLSYTAAAKIGILAKGTGLVRIRAIDPHNYREQPQTRNLPIETHPGFYIQVGAFASRINAENMRSRLGALGNLLVNISAALVDGRTLYRVRIGPLFDVDAADRIVSSLDGIGIFEHDIVVE